MSSFTEPLQLLCVNGSWQTARPLHYEIGLKGSGLLITVPQGYTTDLGTIPRILWMVLPPQDPTCAAAYVLHDYLCTWPEFNRLTADSLFLEALQVLEVPCWKRTVLYYGVRLFARLAGHK